MTCAVTEPCWVQGGPWPPQNFWKKKVDILKYELSLPIKQFSRLDMHLAPQISNKYLEIPQSQLFQQIKGKKKFLLKNSFRAYYSQLHNVRLWFASKIFIERVPICTTMQLQTPPSSSSIGDSLTFYLPLSLMHQLNWSTF